MRPVVLIESPYSGRGIEAIRYLACCFLDSVLRGECPIASHAGLPLALPEHEPGDAPEWPRDADGKLLTGRAIGKECHASLCGLIRDDGMYFRGISRVRYIDIGVSEGTSWNGDTDTDRKLQGYALKVWESGGWPSKARWASTNESEADL